MGRTQACQIVLLLTVGCRGGSAVVQPDAKGAVHGPTVYEYERVNTCEEAIPFADGGGCAQHGIIDNYSLAVEIVSVVLDGKAIVPEKVREYGGGRGQVLHTSGAFVYMVYEKALQTFAAGKNYKYVLPSEKGIVLAKAMEVEYRVHCSDGTVTSTMRVRGHLPGRLLGESAL